VAAEAVFQYYATRTERRARRLRKFEIFLARLNAMLAGKHLVDEEEPEGLDEEETDLPLSDDVAFDEEGEDETWQTTAHIPPETYVLYGMCLLGEGPGNDYVAVSALGRVADLEPETPGAVRDTLEEALGPCARSPVNMRWAEWAAAATLPMMWGAACNKIAAVTNTSGAASRRGAGTRIIGVLMEVLKMDCHGNQDVDVGATSMDPAEWNVLRNRAALVLGIRALHRKVLGQGEVGTREGAGHVDAGVSLLLQHWRLL